MRPPTPPTSGRESVAQPRNFGARRLHGADAAAEVPLRPEHGEAIRAGGGGQARKDNGGGSVKADGSYDSSKAGGADPGLRAGGGMQGTWWSYGDDPRPVVLGVDFALDTEEGGADEFYFVPESDDHETIERPGFSGWDVDFSPDSEAQDSLQVERIGVQDAAVQQQEGGNRPVLRRPLQDKLNEWRQVLVQAEEEISKQKGTNEKKKAVIEDEKPRTDIQPSIEDASQLAPKTSR